MFNIFKNKTKIKDWEYRMLKSIADFLPSKYSFIKGQITHEFILNSIPNEFLENNWKTIVYNQNLYDSFKNTDFNYKLIGVRIYDLDEKSYKDVELDIGDGILIGYRIDATGGNFDFGESDISGLKQVSFENMNKAILDKIIGMPSNEIISQLDLSDTFEITVPEGKFYVIKDLEDGNYLAVDTNGSVYCLIHDLYEIEKLFESVNMFYDALKSNSFSIEDYYENKIS